MKTNSLIIPANAHRIIPLKNGISLLLAAALVLVVAQVGFGQVE